MTHGLQSILGSVIVAIVALADAAPGTAAAPPAFVIRRHVDAEVTSIDPSARAVRLRTDAGRFTLHDVAGDTVKAGARVVLDVAIIRHADPSTVRRSQDGPAPLVAQRLSASVAGIERTVGLVTIASSAGRLRVELPSDLVRTLHTDDPLWLEIAVRPAPDVSASPPGDETRQTNSLKALLLMILGRTR